MGSFDITFTDSLNLDGYHDCVNWEKKLSYRDKQVLNNIENKQGDRTR